MRSEKGTGIKSRVRASPKISEKVDVGRFPGSSRRRLWTSILFFGGGMARERRSPAIHPLAAIVAYISCTRGSLQKPQPQQLGRIASCPVKIHSRLGSRPGSPSRHSTNSRPRNSFRFSFFFLVTPPSSKGHLFWQATARHYQTNAKRHTTRHAEGYLARTPLRRAPARGFNGRRERRVREGGKS